MKALEVVDGMARWIIVHGESSGRPAEPPPDGGDAPGAMLDVRQRQSHALFSTEPLHMANSVEVTSSVS